MNIVLDTNIVASAIFFGGKPREVVELLFLENIHSYVTTEIVEEYEETIEYLKNKYPGKKPQLPLTQIISACNVIDSTSQITICRDPDDDKFINCAKDAQAIYIVRGDKDLLSIQQIDGIEIVTASQFMERYNSIFQGERIYIRYSIWLN